MRVLISISKILLLFMLFNVLPPAACSQDEFQAREGDTTYTMKKYYFCFLKKGPTRDQDSVTAAQIQKGHMAHINSLAEQGKITMAGPFEGDGDMRGILVFTVKSAEEARDLESRDPAVKSGRLFMEIIPWWGAKGTCLK